MAKGRSVAYSPPPLLIDDRVGSKEILGVLPPAVRPRARLERLEFADVAWVGRGAQTAEGKEEAVAVGLERKVIRDLLQSMTTGRLSGHQLVGMRQQYRVIYLLVEGIWRPNPQDGVLEMAHRGGWRPLELGSRRFMAREVNSYLNTLSILGGVHLIQTGTLAHTAMVVSDLYRWWTGKPLNKHKGHLGFDRSGDLFSGEGDNGCLVARLRKPGVVSRMSKELTGVGWEKAQAMAKRFSSPMELALATEKQLMEVPGVGKTLARRMIKELRG